MRQNRRGFVRAGASLLTLGVFSGCLDDPGPRPGDGNRSSASGSEETDADSDSFNDADVSYLQSMIPHHEMAIEMAELVPDRSDRDALHEFAETTVEDHREEVERMATLLEEDGREVPGSGAEDEQDEEDEGDAEDADEGDSEMDEMMESLREASGTEFDLRFADAIIVHYTAAIRESDEVLDAGNASDVADLATELLVGYNDDVETLRPARDSWEEEYDGDYEQPDGATHDH